MRSYSVLSLLRLNRLALNKVLPFDLSHTELVIHPVHLVFLRNPWQFYLWMTPSILSCALPIKTFAESRLIMGILDWNWLRFLNFEAFGWVDLWVKHFLLKGFVLLEFLEVHQLQFIDVGTRTDNSMVGYTSPWTLRQLFSDCVDSAEYILIGWLR